MDHRSQFPAAEDLVRRMIAGPLTSRSAGVVADDRVIRVTAGFRCKVIGSM